ncbi:RIBONUCLEASE P PROTEIN SUBUNIT P38-LIKE PROTEIN [Salix koriyanagi]|uniref:RIBONUCLEASE P PROTEIN SUBUNIT P38-LIKE PROTEIN n=1 Tax=Salix koriyanagi TaxID=2511006 RepID=A0A9Q0PG94_9ROSI|nr:RIBONUCLEASE P PROTEIN SUBUNIT P38-LIKE PROTEIN [Salix koriyanagi]
MFSLHTNLMRSEDPPIERGASQAVKGGSQSIDYDLEYENPEFQKNSEVFSPLSNLYSPEGNDELVGQDWVCSEAEKYAAANEKRHHLEIDAFAEQMRLKDEKLEAFRWRMLSMEIESKRLQSHIEGLNQDVSQIRHENMKLEALLLERQKELTGLKDKNAKKEPKDHNQEEKVHLTETSQEKNTEKEEEDEKALHNQSKKCQ